MTDMVTKEQMIERMARAIANRPIEDMSERFQVAVRVEAERALDASGLWPVYEALCDQKTARKNGSDVGMHIASRRIETALTAMEQTNG